MTGTRTKRSPLRRRKWFDLKTTRGWISALAAFVAVVSSAAGIYVKSSNSKYSSKETDRELLGTNINGSVTVQSGGTSVIGSRNITISSGYTIEQHEQVLKDREKKLRQEFQASLDQSEDRRTTLEWELRSVQDQLRDVQESYRERLAEIKYLAGQLESLRGKVPADKLRDASNALKQGKTQPADELLAIQEIDRMRLQMEMDALSRIGSRLF